MRIANTIISAAILAYFLGCSSGTISDRDAAAGRDVAFDGPRAQDGSQTHSDVMSVRDSAVAMPDAMHIDHGQPGCGLTAAAFCETFDSPSTVHGRAGEMDANLWSASRLAPQLTTSNGLAIGIGPGTIPTCRAGLPSMVEPDQDALICDADSDIESPHLMVVVGAQNYGQNSYRIRQPFDFAGRTGRIVFDAEPYIIDSLLGWISVEVMEDPINAPSFAVGSAGVNNDEGSLIPRSGFEVQFQNTCNGYAPTGSSFSLRMIDVFHNFVDTPLSPATPTCLLQQQGKLSHFEITVSQHRIEVYATPFSSDGITFGATTLLYAADVDLPFSRGWVSITTHNHATLKYSVDRAGRSIDAWIARWDNVGFDGPVISNWREYEVPDSLIPGEEATNRHGPVLSMGYRIADESTGPSQTLHLPGVDLTHVTAARISTSSWYLTGWDGFPVADFVLRYRFNGGPWRDRPINSDEISVITGGHSQGQIGQIIDVAVSDLVQGDNTLEFVTSHVPQAYPPGLANIDLVLTTE